MPLKKSIIHELKEILGENNVQTDVEDLIAYSVDASPSSAKSPDIVVHPGSHNEVVLIAKAASAAGIPLIPRGAGTGLSGGSLAVKGGIVMAFDRMNRIISMDSRDMLAVVEPGVVNWDLQKEVSAASLFYPPDPSSAMTCTIGGNVAENASGPRGVKYGATADYLLGLQCVLASGESLRVGGIARRDVMGYDLMHLIAGSEGTLAIITEVMVRLLPKPRHRRAVTFTFESIVAAGEAVVALGSTSPTPSAIEIMDQTAIECARKYSSGLLPGDGAAQLLVEVDGGDAETLMHIELVNNICQTAGGTIVTQASTEAEVDALWDARRSISASLGGTGRKKIGEDISVPRSRVPEMIAKIEEIAEKNGIAIAVFGHAGSGNLHPNLLIDERDPEENRRAHIAVTELFSAAVKLGGSLSGEHGIGTTKAPFLNLAIGSEELALMKKIKQVFDPLGIMNPGKIFDEAGAEK